MPGTGVKPVKFRVNPTVHVYVSSGLVVEESVHAQQANDGGIVEFVTDAPCTINLLGTDGALLFGAVQVSLDPGPNLVAIAYNNPPGETSKTFQYVITPGHSLTLKGQKHKTAKKTKALKAMKAFGSNPNDIIVP